MSSSISNSSFRDEPNVGANDSATLNAALAGTPGAPLSVKVEKDTDGWVLTWMPPDTDGGAPILSYAVEFRY